jgi:hypothetical protein
MTITPYRVALRDETVLVNPSFTMVRSAVPYDTNNSRTCLFVRARQSDGTAGVDVWDVADPPNAHVNLKATLNRVPFQDKLFLYPLGAIDNAQYIDLPVVMMGPADKGVAAILRPFGTPKIVERNPLGVSALYPGIGLYAPPELSTLPGLAFYVSDSDYVYFLRAGTGLLDLVGRSKPPEPGTILTRPTDNLELGAPKPATSRTVTFFKTTQHWQTWFICNPETGYTELPQSIVYSDIMVPATPVSVLRSGPSYSDACLVMYFHSITNLNIMMFCEPNTYNSGYMDFPGTSSVSPVASGPYVYFVGADLQSIQIVTGQTSGFVYPWGQRGMPMPGVIVGQPCLGANGELIVTYDGRSSLRPSGCLAIGTDGTIKWTYEPAGSWPLTAAVFSQGWIGFSGATAENKPFVDLFANPE